MSDPDLIIVGGGPAGLATAIRGRLAGLGVMVLDGAQLPADRPCGEGIMPEGADQLDALGVRVPDEQQRAFRGIRYLDGDTVAEGLFGGRPGVGIRRPPQFDRARLRGRFDTSRRLVWKSPLVFRNRRAVSDSQKERHDTLDGAEIKTVVCVRN